MIEVPHPSCAAAARAHVAMLRASGSYRHHLTLLSSHVCSLTRVKRTPSTSETAGGGEALGNAKEGGGEGEGGCGGEGEARGGGEGEARGGGEGDARGGGEGEARGAGISKA